METEKEVATVMSELQFGNGSSLYSALIMIRTTLIKSRSALRQLVQLGAVKYLIQLLEDRRRHVNQTKTTDIVMSILANLCLEEDIRKKVVSCEGLSVIARVTLASEQESIQNRGIRALSNLAQDVENCGQIFDLEVPTFVAKRLMETEDVECQSTYCRALQLFGQMAKDAKRLMEETQAIQALAALLKLDNKKLALKSLRILSELSALRCCPSFTGQILAANILEELVTFADDEDSSSASWSLSIILRLCEQEIMRPALGSAGVITLLVKLMKSDRSHVNKVWTLNALCLCTKEAVNRNKIQESGGLQLFISALNEIRTDYLSEGQFSVLYDRIISSLVNFLYNDDCLGKLLELGLVKILTYHLKRSCAFTSLNEDFRKEVDSLAMLLDKDQTALAEKRGVLGKVNDADGSISNSISLEEEDVQLIPNSVPFPICESDSVSVHHDSESFETEHVTSPPDSDNPTLGNQLEETYKGVSKEKHEICNAEVDLLIIESSVVISNDGVEADVECEQENMTSADDIELPFQQTSQSRHTFSINSPTYQMETSWKLEDYTSGVTCKSFSQEQEVHRIASDYYPSPNSVNTSMAQAPYSPLSAGASYYSPSHSSPAHSILLSPVQSTISSSPTSTYATSPVWLFSSPDNQDSPVSAGRLFSPNSAASMSPLPLTYQNQFSPISHDFPISPLFSERYSQQSPTPSSQTSLFSQDTAVAYFDRHINSLDNTASSEHIHQLLTESSVASSSEILFTAKPVSHDTVTDENVYSASEDSDVDCELHSSPVVSECDHETVELHHKKVNDNYNTNENTQNNPVQVLSHKRCQTMDNATSSKNNPSGVLVQTMNSKRRRLSLKASSAVETVKEICATETTIENASKVTHHLSDGFSLDTCFSDDEEIINLTPDHIVTKSSMVFSLPSDGPDLHLKGISSLSSFKTDIVNMKKDIHRPASVSPDITENSGNKKGKSFQRLSSYPGKEKLPGLPSNFRKHLSAAVSPSSRLGVSPLAAATLPVSKYQTSHLISDSPYRSPYPEPAHFSMASKDDFHNSAETTKGAIGSHSKELSANKSVIFPEKNQNVFKIDDTVVASSKTRDSTTKVSSRSHHNTNNDARVKKIQRTTEMNILILLARVSVKTNPTHLLAETTVISCLLGYMATAPNPIRRSCRIVQRICSNPLCFEKLILMQMPAIIVKSLVLEKDGSFPENLFCNQGDSRNISDFLPSSQGSSECSASQTSEFGRKMDFEFGGDAYSRMTSKKHSSAGSLFQSRPSLSVDSEAARDGLTGSDDIYEVGCSRVEARVKIGLELLNSMGAVAMSRFGEGEIKHVLLRYSSQDKLACIMSMLHLRVAWCRITRHKFFTNYSVCEKILPYLFTCEAPLARETIVAGISLNVHLDNPPKRTQKIIQLPVCPNLKGTIDSISIPGNNAESKLASLNSKIESRSKLSIQYSDRTEITAASSTSQNTSLILQSSENKDNIMDCSSSTSSLCQHQNMSQLHDVCFFIHGDNEAIHKVSAHRQILMEKSEVFAAMFCGSYAESCQSEIKVSDVNSYAYEFIIHYLHGCSSGCPVIDSLCMESIQDEIFAKEVCVESHTLERQELDSTVQMNKQVLDDKDFYDKQRFLSCELNVSVPLPEDKINNIKMCSVETNLKAETSKHISQTLEFTHSESTLESLSIQDWAESGQASRKLNFQDSEKNESTDICRVNKSEMCRQKETTEKCLDELISKCGNIIALADRFLLPELVNYPASVLSHVCLGPSTIEDIFHLACFHKLDSLALDCIRETLMSCLPCNDAAAIYLELAADGYREQVLTALTWLLNYLHSD